MGLVDKFKNIFSPQYGVAPSCGIDVKNLGRVFNEERKADNQYGITGPNLSEALGSVLGNDFKNDMQSMLTNAGITPNILNSLNSLNHHELSGALNNLALNLSENKQTLGMEPGLAQNIGKKIKIGNMKFPTP